MKYALYNPYSGHGESKDIAKGLAREEEITLISMEGIDYKSFFEGLDAAEMLIICGGDGTLNRFINDTDGLTAPCPVYYMPCGTGNDFALDIGKQDTKEPVAIDEYIKNLPTVTVKGKTYKFINGVGYGIDGYCCEVGDKMKLEGKQPNYTSIAISGLLFHFKPVDATITVDGVEKTYKKVWIAPTMLGSHYGGGMIPTPEQKRDNPEGTLSLMVFHGSGKIKTLMIFPSIFKGEHVKRDKYVTVLTGKEITVKFNRPTALQIDGETILDVEEYTARAYAPVAVTE